ncbi:Hypothetical predicted protein [Mytilus galloprovincialis]|uniref:Neurotransmitter-gated ion-channel ligand-binding domain-containing protein n=1 Tax=Mytilus galloprovincialis TaxID=29158 RepID=A0A8B6CZ70_MYTGA|nr:Hypothetical predicted protein [Mytilus galloprovincialis]
MRFQSLRVLLMFSISNPCIEFVHAQSHTDVKKLHTDMFTDYKKEVLPTADQSKPLVIGVTFFMASFNSFNEVEETISLTAAVGMNWTDPALKWNPTLYGNLYGTIINPKDLWLPQLFLINRVDSMDPVGDDTMFFPTIIYTGEVIYSPGGILKAKCPTDISKFPFDSQTCTLQLMPWGFIQANLLLTSNFDKAQLDFFSQHSDWNLLEYSISIVNESLGYSVLNVKLTFEREPLYFAVMIILPTLLFSLLNPLVFVFTSRIWRTSVIIDDNFTVIRHIFNTCVSFDSCVFKSYVRSVNCHDRHHLYQRCNRNWFHNKCKLFLSQQ